MRVRHLFGNHSGDVVEVNQETAEWMISRGRAVAVQEGPSQQAITEAPLQEPITEAPLQDATKPRRRRRTKVEMAEARARGEV